MNSKEHGRWVTHFANNSPRLKHDYHNGSRKGQSGVYITKNGERHPGR